MDLFSEESRSHLAPQIPPPSSLESRVNFPFFFFFFFQSFDFPSSLWICLYRVHPDVHMEIDVLHKL